MASLRNPVAAQLSLFEKVNCKAVVTCSSLAQGLKPLLDSCARMRMIRAPTLDELLDEEAVPHYAFDATYEEVAHKKTITFHTSGSSGEITTLTIYIRSSHWQETQSQSRIPMQCGVPWMLPISCRSIKGSF
jgi:hypothetical protein